MWKYLTAAAFAIATLPAGSASAANPTHKPAVKPAPKKPTAHKPTAKKKVSAKRGQPKAEDEEDYQWAVGLTGGLNIAGIGGEPLGGVEGAESNTNIGLNIGILALYNLASFADVEFGLGYSTKGYAVETETKSPSAETLVTVTDTFSYVEVPVGIRLNYPAGSIRPYLSLGLYMGILVSSEREELTDTEYPLAPGPCPTATDPSKMANSCSNTGTVEVPGASVFDAGFRVGLGAEMDLMDAVTLFVGAGYSRGFTDPIDETAKADSVSSGQTPEGEAPAAPTTKTVEVKNVSQAHSVIQANLGLLYQF